VDGKNQLFLLYFAKKNKKQLILPSTIPLPNPTKSISFDAFRKLDTPLSNQPITEGCFFIIHKPLLNSRLFFENVGASIV
jgi:hypothetical protein